MQSLRSKEKGFTLVEMLIVLGILAVLALVVVFSVAGMFSRGGKEAWNADRGVIQNSVILFYYDIHKYDSASGWNEVTGIADHYYPTLNGQPSTNNITDLLAAANSDADPQHYFSGGYNGAMWMGVLFNSPGSADATDPESPAGSSPMTDECGPYLNEIPQSSSANNGNNSGGYTWVIVRDGVVNSVYWNGSEWKAGFSGSYP